MTFTFSSNTLPRADQKLQRIFEIIPGLVSWSILLGVTGLSVIKPLWAALFIIAFDLYWLLRLLYMTVFLVLSFYRLRAEKKTDWRTRIQNIDRLTNGRGDFQDCPSKNIQSRISSHFHRQELETLAKSPTPPPLSSEIYQLVIVPIAKEPKHIVESNIKSLKAQHFPRKQMIVVLAVEERAPEAVKRSMHLLRQDYQDFFCDLRLVIHPADIPGEARVKGANTSYAAKHAADFLKTRSIPFERVIVSCLDADTVVDPDYFTCLTYYFMVTPDRTRASFQPIPVYHNNIWEVPGFTRVIESGSSFFQLIESTNPEQLVTFSSHSMSFKALVDIGYWPVDMISDDSAIFWKAFIHYKGNYKVVPMYITVSMDIVAADTLWQTIIGVYKQKRRWAWGVENFPVVMRAFLSSHAIPLSRRLRFGFKLLEGHVSWATWGFLLTVLSWLPTFFARKEFLNSAAYYNVPFITGTIFHFATLSLIISIILSLLLLPQKTIRHPVLKRLLFAIQWLLMPAILLFLSALPALDAQTRLMLGLRMEFWIAGKRKT